MYPFIVQQYDMIAGHQGKAIFTLCECHGVAHTPVKHMAHKRTCRHTQRHCCFNEVSTNVQGRSKHNNLVKITISTEQLCSLQRLKSMCSAGALAVTNLT